MSMMSITIKRRRFTILTAIVAILVATNYAPRTTAKQSPQAVSEGALYRGDAQRTGAYNQPAIRENPRLQMERLDPRHRARVTRVCGWRTLFRRRRQQDPRVRRRHRRSVVGVEIKAFQQRVLAGRCSRWLLSMSVSKAIVCGPLMRATGDRLWKFKAKGVVWTAPLIVNRTIYFGNAEGTVLRARYHYSRTAVENKYWPAILWPAAYDNGTIFLAAENVLYALNSETGQEKWKVEKASAEWWNPPAISGGVVFAGSGDGNFYAIDSQTGAVLWSAPGEGDVWSGRCRRRRSGLRWKQRRVLLRVQRPDW